VGARDGTKYSVAHIAVTRPAGRERELVERLRELGHDVTHVPLVAIELLGDDDVDVSGYDWVVITSAIGARELRRRMRGAPPKVAAIGRATAEAFGGVDVVAETATQEGVVAALPTPPGRVLFAGAEGARPYLQEALGADVVHLYRTIQLVPEEWPTCDLVVLASPSAARAYAKLTARVPAVSIGPETTRAARDVGVTIVAEATTSDVGGLLAAVGAVVGPP
jgi:uroporphyrinogen-III synthase